MQRPPKGPAGGAVAKSHIPAAPVIGSLPAPRFSLDMPEIYLPPASLEASSLVRLCARASFAECRMPNSLFCAQTVHAPPAAAPRGVISSSAPAISFMGKAAAARYGLVWCCRPCCYESLANLPLCRPSPSILSSSPTVLGLLQTRTGGAPMHAGEARAPGAGEASLTAALRGFSLGGGSTSASDEPFAKAAVADASPRPTEEGGLAAALHRRPVAAAATSSAAAAPAPARAAAPVLLSASFRDRPAFLAPPIAEGEEQHDAALDSSDDEHGGRRGGAAARLPLPSASGGPSGARKDSALSEDEEDEDDDAARGGGGRMRDEAAEELQL